MEPLTEKQIRACFVNCTRGEASRLRLPGQLEAMPWADLDLLGWIDPRAPLQGYLVVPADGRVVGLQLRRNQAGEGPRRTRMCSLCLTTHPGSGVSLMVAPRSGRSGRDGNSVGVDVCSDLDCSRYVRGLVPVPTLSRLQETLTIDERAARLRRNVEAFVRRV